MTLNLLSGASIRDADIIPKSLKLLVVKEMAMGYERQLRLHDLPPSSRFECGEVYYTNIVDLRIIFW